MDWDSNPRPRALQWNALSTGLETLLREVVLQILYIVMVRFTGTFDILVPPQPKWKHIVT